MRPPGSVWLHVFVGFDCATVCSFCHCLCRVLTPALLKEYRRLTTDIHGHVPFVVHERARVAVTGEDMKLCGPGKWVGDACINMYMALLQVRVCRRR